MSENRRVRTNGSAMVSAAFFLGAGLLLLGLIVRRTGGHFSYCLDDPYIHMALAERLRHGLYGINAGEPASPSSSILWPLLLVPFAGTALLPWVPLVLNLGFGTATAWLLGRFATRYFEPGWRTTGLALLLVAGLNLLGLAYTGLEHPLEVLLCVAAAFAVMAVIEGEHVPWGPVGAALLLPSVRYEGVLIPFAVAVALWAEGRRRAALLLVPVSLVPAAVFSVYLHHLRLPWFPLSVLVKSSYKFQDHSSLPVRAARLVVETLAATLKDTERAPQFLLVLVLAALAWRARRSWRTCLALAGTATAGTVQVFLGPVGWFYRYEIYCLAFTLPIAIAAAVVLAKDETAAEVRPMPLPGLSTGVGRVVPGSVLVLAGALAMLYARPQLAVPDAALGIWQEQAQLGRFASEFYTGPVALNDLGWVSYLRTPQQYTLDLVGLGSYETYKTKERDRTPAWMDAVVREHSIGLAMLYPEWFPQGVPKTWTPLAKLCANAVDPALGGAAPRVMFYATPSSDQAQIMRKLGEFRAGLPAGAVLQLRPVDASATCPAQP